VNERVNATLLLLLIGLLLAGCGGLSSPQDDGQRMALIEVLPGMDEIPDWSPDDEARTFDAENLYDLVDGQAESFFAYAFEEVVVRSYTDGTGAVLRLEVWQLASPTDAYGLLTTYRAGTPVSVGNEGDGDPGRRLDFWQDRYFVRVFALQPVTDADLQAFAQAVAAALPAGGERPALLDRLPTDARVERSAIFFRQEISIQSYLWLGGQNLLGLSPETEGVLARYDLGDATVQLLLVQYPDAEAAAAGLEALQTGQIGDVVAAQARENLLAAAFGGVDEAVASDLLAAALRND
jgi:hypothetical protein